MSGAERWMPIPGFSRYEVSDRGRVRLLAGRVLKLSRIRRYLSIAIANDEGCRVRRFAHVLVLLAFVGPKPLGQESRHLNGVPDDDNRVENLAWATHRENIADKHAHGTRVLGARSPRAKLTDAAVRSIRAAQGVSVSELARRFGVSRRAVAFVLQRKTWAHVAASV